MSIKVMTRVWDYCPQQGEALLVMLAMADWCNDEGECHPSVSKLATKARITVRSVYRVLNKLETDDEIEIEVGGGRGKTSVYRLPKYTAAPRPELRANGDDMSGYSGKGDAASRNGNTETLTAVHGNPDSGDKKTLTAATPPIKRNEPSLRTVNEPSVGVARKPRKPRKSTPPPESRPGPFADVCRALCRIRRLNPDVIADTDRANIRRLASTITHAGIEDPATVEAWGREWYASKAKETGKAQRDITPPTVGQLTSFMGAKLPRKADSSSPAILDEDAIRARWPGLTFIAPNGRLSVKSPHALACEGKVEKDSYDYLDRSTWPADVRECVAAVAALHGQAVGR